MELLLVQHGEAMSKEEDPDRPLTARGAEDAKRVAAFAARHGVRVDRILHSGKLRAQQTAGHFADALKPAQGATAQENLGAEDEVRPVADGLGGDADAVMIVGHLPFLGRLAALLVTGDEGTPVVHFRNAGIVCLAGDAEGWSVAWAVPPALAG